MAIDRIPIAMGRVPVAIRREPLIMGQVPAAIGRVRPVTNSHVSEVSSHLMCVNIYPTGAHGFFARCSHV
jgi:hypothetical protein